MSNELWLDQLDQAIDALLSNTGMPPVADSRLAELLALAADLRDLPAPDFKETLRRDLEMKAMSTKNIVVREGFRTVTPYLLVNNEEAISFIKDVFGAQETFRAGTGRGSHVELRIGDSMLMVGLGSSRQMPTALHVHVENADEIYRHAIAAGAVNLQEMIEGHGERLGCVQDSAGNQWYIATHLGGHYTPASLHDVTVFFHPPDAASFIAFLKEAFEAQEVERYDSADGKVLHAKVRIGSSVIETSEARDWWKSMPTMIMMYVPDVDSAFERASRAAGAKPLGPLTNQPYGRTGGIEDPFGNQWFLTTPRTADQS